MPKYPTYPSQPNSGNLPSMFAMGPPDLRASSSTASYYQGKIDRSHGRHLAGGLGSSEMEPAYAFNELAVMAEMDDIQGNGIFDPYGAQKNIHPGAGVFAVNYSLPGMHARERPFGFSEERDITTGRPIRAVPSGAVANDSSAQIAFLEQGLYPRPTPMVGLAKQMTPFDPTWNVMQNPAGIAPPPSAVDGFGADEPASKLGWGVIALVAVGVGLLVNEARKVRA
jgi:hypothetical protein